MNKTVTANIGGMVFHVEVDAYESLNNYLSKIRSYFQNSDEREEILADIELRIAELLNPKLSASNQVIKMKDVEEVIQVMGKPEQFLTDEEEGFNSSSSTSSSENSRQSRTRKRLFRDPDDRMLGGVASGIAHYLGLDPMWIRLLFVVIFLAGTSGFWIYVILWIVMPEAKTAAEKLQMKGEPVNIDNIGKAFEEGAKKMNDKFKEMDSTKFGNKVEGFFESVFHVLGVLVTGFLKFFGKLLGIALLVVGSLLAFSLLTGMLSADTVIYAFSPSGMFSMESNDLFLSIFSSETQFLLAKISILVLFGIPILALIYGGVRLLFNIKGHQGIGSALGILWLVGLAASIVIALQLGSEFKSNSKITEYETVDSNYNEYVLALSQDKLPGNELISSSENEFILHYDKSSIYYGMPTLNIERSYKDSLELRISKKSRGSSKNNSTEKARNINYEFKQQGELLTFNPYISFDRHQKVRGQEVQLTLLLPLGKVVYLDESMRDFIYDIENVTDTWDDDMLGKKWIMLEDGLTCLDCPDIEGVSSGDSRFLHPDS